MNYVQILTKNEVSFKNSLVYSLIVIGSAISDAPASDNDVKKNSHTIESMPSPSPSSPITDLSASTSKSIIVTEPLPDDDASFEIIRTQGTGTLEYLLNRGKKLFIFTRARWFGKSLLVKMTKSFFHSEQPFLFKGQKIGKRGNIVHKETSASPFNAILRSLKRYLTLMVPMLKKRNNP